LIGKSIEEKKKRIKEELIIPLYQIGPPMTPPLILRGVD
tara:strand:+ start:1447 stop:1563 length:117 start_codon:yes stop_codon:yes gene_type:complete